MKPRFYFPDLLAKQVFNYKQSHHLKNVLRLKVGEKILLFDGHGREVTASITLCSKKSVCFELIDEIKTTNRENKLSITVGQGLCQSARMDYVVQKSSELGATIVAPILTERCQVRQNHANFQKKVQRWRLIAEHASQQCGRNKLTNVLFPQKIGEFLEKNKARNSINLILNPMAKKQLIDLDFSSAKSVVLLIGPEAGFSNSEEIFAQKSNFHNIKLGQRILRTETVAVSLISILNYICGEF